MKMRFKGDRSLEKMGRGLVGPLHLSLMLLTASTTVLAQQPAGPVGTATRLPLVATTAPVQTPIPSKNVSAPAGARLKMVSTSTEDGKLVVSLTVTGPVEYKRFMLKDPSRFVLDLINVECRVPFQDLQVNAGSVKQIRIGHSNGEATNVSRLVFDLEQGYKKPEIVMENESVRVIFAGGETTAKPVDTAAAPEPTAKPNPAAMKASSDNRPPTAVKTKATPGSAAPVAKSTSQKPAAEKPPVSSVPHEQAASAPAKASRPGTPSVKPASTSMTDTVQPASTSSVSRSTGERAVPAPKPVSSSKVDPPQQASLGVSEIGSDSPATGQAAVPQAPPTPPVALAPSNPPAIPPQQSTPPPAAAPQESGRFSGTPLTLDLVDIPLIDFFRLMAEEGGVNIVMDPGIKGTISIKVVKVPWDQIFEAALANHNLDKQVEGNLIRIALKSTLQEEAKQREALKKANVLAADVETKIKRLNYAKAATLVPTLEEQKSVRGTIVIDERTNSLVITDIPSYIPRILALVETLDVAQPQVEIEARIVSATRDFARDIGVQFGFVQGNLQRVTVGGPNTFGTIGGTRPSATPTSTFAAGNPVTGRGASEGTASQSGAVSTGTGSGPPAGNYNINLPASKAFGGLGISVGNIFDTFLLDAAITAGETKGLAKLISQPKTVAQNNSPAMITQGLRFPVQIIANNTITVQFQNAALTLTVTPQITLEGNIILDLSVENNTPDFSRQVNGIPSIRTSESKTRVLVSDGGTTVIGGILIDNETTQDDRIPGLGSLPVIGYMFRRTSVSHSTQEVLFFITPKVIK